VLAVVPRLIWVLMSVWGRTWRFEVIAEEGATPLLFGKKPGPSIFCLWHQCVLTSTVYFRHSNTVLLISQSYDGEFTTRVVNLFGFGDARGSSTRGSREGLRGLKQAIASGGSCAFTADGPRGPIHQSKMGPIKLAQMTGAPIHIFHIQPERTWNTRSWDRFQVPKPFTRIVFSWAKDMRVPADLAADQLEPMREELNAALERARMKAENYFKKDKG
jgi:lysophospholipid acyltransferase (LPLAT)-like uncharacterized protein